LESLLLFFHKKSGSYAFLPDTETSVVFLPPADSPPSLRSDAFVSRKNKSPLLFRLASSKTVDGKIFPFSFLFTYLSVELKKKKPICCVILFPRSSLSSSPSCERRRNPLPPPPPFSSPFFSAGPARVREDCETFHWVTFLSFFSLTTRLVFIESDVKEH